jgi:hypothetical protein
MASRGPTLEMILAGIMSSSRNTIWDPINRGGIIRRENVDTIRSNFGMCGSLTRSGGKFIKMDDVPPLAHKHT